MSKKTTTKTTKPRAKASKGDGAAKTARLRKEALAVADANLARIDGAAETPADSSYRLAADTPVTGPEAATDATPAPKGKRKGRAPKDATQGADAARANVGRKRAKAEPKPKKVSGLDLAAQVLAEAQRPLPAKDIAELVLAAGWASKGATPEATLYAAITREIKAKGEAARFRKTDRGLFEATGKAA